MIRPLSKFLSILLLMASVASSYAKEELPISGILNPDSASLIGSISTINEFDEAGVFVVTPAGELAISMLRSEIVELSNEQLGGFLIVYEETGQALFELPDGSYQMQLTTTNGPIDFSYLNQDSAIQDAERLTMEEDLLMQESEDGLYQLYLLTTGELRVKIAADEGGDVYMLTFTGIPALDIKEEVISS